MPRGIHPNSRANLHRGGPGRPKGAKNKLSVERVEREISHQALFDPRKLLARIGRGKHAIFTLREIAELPDEVAACLASYDVVLGNENKSDGSLETVVRVRWYDKQKALELCAKHFGWVTERHEVGITAELEAILNEGRARNAARKP